MNLVEHEGKRLFARYGITVPRGALWPEVPAGLSSYVVKAQMRSGGRGKRGGIRFVDTADAVDAVARQLVDGRLGADAIEGVYVEERLAIRRELYLAVAVDRDSRCRVLLASPRGGVDIEDVPDKEILRIPVDPSIDLAPSLARHVACFLDEAGGQRDTIEATVRALHTLAVAEDAMLAEINPLAITDDGKRLPIFWTKMLFDRGAFTLIQSLTNCFVLASHASRDIAVGAVVISGRESSARDRA